MLANLKQIINRSPKCCGCYLWKDAKDTILYIGKARNLKARLQSYLRGTVEHRRVLSMLEQAHSIEWIITQTENEALLLEADLVKRHSPRFNVRLKDDKRYPYLCVSLSEPFPQVFLTRNVKQDGNLYFGPYSDVKATRHTLALIHKIFPVRKVRQKLPFKAKQKIRRPCMNFYIKRCLAPCQGNVAVEEYQKIIDEIVLFLEGRTEILEEVLRERMATYSQAEAFEKATIYRDMIFAIRKVTENQVVHSQKGEQDVLALARYEDHGQIVILEIREGRMIGRKTFPLNGLTDAPEHEVIEAFIRDYYFHTLNVTKNIQVPVHLPQAKLLVETLQKSKGYKINFFTPRSERAKSVYKVAERNAHFLLRDRLLAVHARNEQEALEDIQTLLKLEKPPDVMECYDISHIHGFETVASSVLFIAGKPQSAGYRHYRIRNVDGINDPASMQEVIERRISRLLQHNQKLPDLFLIDGGLSQVNAAYEAAQNLGVGDLPFVGLAKKHEEIYFPQRNQPHKFDPNSPGMRLLRKMRNEAHRFAVQYHRKRRNRATVRHVLDGIPNLGKSRKQALLKHFTNSSMEKANVEQLVKVPGIGHRMAARIYEAVAKQSKNSVA